MSIGDGIDLIETSFSTRDVLCRRHKIKMEAQEHFDVAVSTLTVSEIYIYIFNAPAQRAQLVLFFYNNNKKTRAHCFALHQRCVFTI